MDGTFYPIILNLKDKRCVVVGGGEVAFRKVKGLIDAGAQVKVVSPTLHPNLEKCIKEFKIEYIPRRWCKEDLNDCFLVIVATNDNALNKEIGLIAQNVGILVNVVDSAEDSNFIVPSSIKRGDLIIGVSTSGASPALAAKIKRELEMIYGKEYEDFLCLLKDLRPKIQRRYKDEEKRRLFWYRLVESNWLETLKKKGRKGINSLIEEVLKEIDSKGA